MLEKKKELGDKVAVANMEFERFQDPLIRSSNKQKSEGESRRRKEEDSGETRKTRIVGLLGPKGLFTGKIELIRGVNNTKSFTDE